MEIQIPIFAQLRTKDQLTRAERTSRRLLPLSFRGQLADFHRVLAGPLGLRSASSWYMFHHSRSMEPKVLGEARQVRLFRIGRNQAVRIPRGFELPGAEATIRKVGDRLILEPVHHKSLLQALSAMTPLALEDDFPDVDKTLEPLDEAPFGLGV